MKTVLILSILLILQDNCNGFTFMKNWKIPGMGNNRKKQELLVKEKFGDKSKLLPFPVESKQEYSP